MRLLKRYGLLFWLLTGVAFARELPAPPTTFVHDEVQALRPETAQALNNLFRAHQDSTSEQVVIAVFKGLEGEELVDWTNQVFRKWKLGAFTKNNGVLLALYWQDRKMRIEVGYGLEAVLTDARSRAIIEEAIVPDLKAGNPDLALTRAAIAILRTIESPLLTNGQAEAILQGANLRARKHPTPLSGGGGIALFIIIMGFIILGSVLAKLQAAEAHYTGRGWTRPSPFRRGPFDGGFGGGGGGGIFGGRSGGGFGGFSGGGGLSGGGGASGSW